MAIVTQKERLATLKAQQGAHAREHSFLRELWTTHLETINARLASIERALESLRSNGSSANERRRFTRRDVGVFGTSAAVATALWWLVDLLGLAVGK